MHDAEHLWAQDLVPVDVGGGGIFDDLVPIVDFEDHLCPQPLSAHDRRALAAEDFELAATPQQTLEAGTGLQEVFHQPDVDPEPPLASALRAGLPVVELIKEVVLRTARLDHSQPCATDEAVPDVEWLADWLERHTPAFGSVNPMDAAQRELVDLLVWFVFQGKRIRAQADRARGEFREYAPKASAAPRVCAPPPPNQLVLLQLGLQTRSKHLKHPTTTVRVLCDWYNGHIEFPYPSAAEKRELARQASLSVLQVTNWFINTRKRHWKFTPHARARARGKEEGLPCVRS